MKKTVKIGGTLGAVLPTASWANLKPGYVFEEIYEDCTLSDEWLDKRDDWIHERLMGKIAEADAKATIERIQRERQDLRFLRSPITKKMLPSVTSIINYDSDFFCSQEELRQYASQGNIIDAKVKHYIKMGQWVEAKELKDIWIDMVILKKGDLKLELDVGDFPAFLEKHPIKDMKVGERFFFDEEGYCGEPDFFGVPDFKEAEKIPTVFDVKRTASKLKNGMQLVAYARRFNIQQAIIVQLSDKTNQGFSKPIVYNKESLEGYWTLFKNKQKGFKQRYNV